MIPILTALIFAKRSTDKVRGADGASACNGAKPLRISADDIA
jgi:hypothetical protein